MSMFISKAAPTLSSSMGGVRLRDQRDVFAASMPAHTDQYYRSFKNQTLKSLDEKSSLMQVDLSGKFLSGSNDE